MLNADDQETVISVRRLKDVSADVSAGNRPIVLWVGAGASRWLEYPSWKELTLRLRGNFYRLVSGFNNSRAIRLINKEDFPEVFQLCKDLDSATYHRLIAGEFEPRPITDTYARFITLVRKISPLFVLTSNVDEMLEGQLGDSAIIQKSDLPRCIDLLQRRVPFIAKLHGSVSSVESMVFTTADYSGLINSTSYVQTLKYIFASCSVVFLGYGVRDSYVIRLLAENAAESDLFGPGPHFVVTNDAPSVASLRPIRYHIKLHRDHRAALSVLDVIRQAAEAKVLVSAAPPDKLPIDENALPFGAVPSGKTAYYISDITAPGTWQTSQEITAKQEDGRVVEGAVGLGFTNDEVPFREGTALHDLAVALICFDYVYVPLGALPRVLSVLREDLFRELLKRDCFRLIHSTAEIGILFQPQEAIGDLGNLTLRAKEGGAPEGLSARIRRILNAVPGKEAEAEAFFEQLEVRTAVYERADEIQLPSMVRSAFLMPGISKLLGIGDAILPTQAPRWLRYPYLRMAHLVQTAVLCTEYGIQACKLPFGGTQLTSAAFGVQSSSLDADSVASYVSTGAFNSDLGAFLLQDMSIIRKILYFRDSPEGESFRRETGQALSVGDGREFNASVNAGLKRTIPFETLQRARDRLLTLMTERALVTPVPAVWGDSRRSDTSTRFWRARSEKMLLELCSTRGIGKNDPCICGSGEKLRLCC